MHFNLKTKHKPKGDQAEAIKALIDGIKANKNTQTLYGVTGSGKTFTVANVINSLNKPTLVIAHNKTLAAQLVEEYREIFPNDEVHYFVSYYDYYQPEAYIPHRDAYIEKEAQINKQIDMMRHSTTQALLTKSNVIVVASVSAIYGLSSPREYKNTFISIAKNQNYEKEEIIKALIGILYERVSGDLNNGKFRVLGARIELMPVNENVLLSLEFEKNKVKTINKLDIETREIIAEDLKECVIFPAKHFITDKSLIGKIVKEIKKDSIIRLKELEKLNKLTERDRLKLRVQNDLILIKQVGYCNGIENYSRYFDGRNIGEPPYTLLDYFNYATDNKKDFLVVVDESHVTLPQIEGMYPGDRARKKTLVEYGFRLKSALDNRPLTFDEFNNRVNNIIYVSATPGKYELDSSKNIVSQILRPTGVVDPIIEVRKVSKTSEYKGQIFDAMMESKKVIKASGRVLLTTTTKKTAELLSEHLKKNKIKAAYLHGDIKTIERLKILNEFRKGIFDVLVGVNLLREGLDLPEVVLVGILDADREGFLRNRTSLIQTIGRAARNIHGRVILYADKETKSIKETILETTEKRNIQLAFNKQHNITPKTIVKNIKNTIDTEQKVRNNTIKDLLKLDLSVFEKKTKTLLSQKTKILNKCVKQLDFKTAAVLRDEIIEIEKIIKEKNE